MYSYLWVMITNNKDEVPWFAGCVPGTVPQNSALPTSAVNVQIILKCQHYHYPYFFGVEISSERFLPIGEALVAAK